MKLLVDCVNCQWDGPNLMLVEINKEFIEFVRTCKLLVERNQNVDGFLAIEVFPRNLNIFWKEDADGVWDTNEDEWIVDGDRATELLDLPEYDGLTSEIAKVYCDGILFIVDEKHGDERFSNDNQIDLNEELYA